MKTLRNHLKSFIIEDERGGITLLMLVMFIGILLLTGFALDFAKHESQRADLTYAVDRGVLAAASLRQDLKSDAEVKALIQSYVDNRPLAGPDAPVQLTTNLDMLNARQVAAGAGFAMDTDFLRMMGLTEMDVAAVSQAEQRATKVEISLIIDISGTMRWTGLGGGYRMAALIPAAKEFVRVVLDADRAGLTSINLIRYAGQTNPGEWMFRRLGGRSCTPARAAMTGLDADGDYLDPECNPDTVNVDYWTEFEAAVADAEADGFSGGALESEVNDRMEAFDPPIPMWATDESHCLQFYSSSNVSAPSLPGGDLREVSLTGTSVEDFAHTYLPNMSDGINLDDSSRDQVAEFMYYPIANNWMEWGWCPKSEMAIKYMLNDEQTLYDEIDKMATFDGSGNATSGNLHDGTGTYHAMKWGLALLNPKTRPILADMFADMDPAEAAKSLYTDRPADWAVADADNTVYDGDPETMKVIVLMTDGQVNHDRDPPNKDEPFTVNEMRERDIRDMKGDGWFSDASQSIPRNRGDDLLLRQCDLAKEKGVRVFTIAFETDDGEMNACASSAADSYEANNLNVTSVFRQIATTVQNLKLTPYAGGTAAAEEAGEEEEG